MQRGFGGSRLIDCAQFVDRLVLPYQPRLIAAYAQQGRNLDYIDIYSAMLDAQGQPRRELFGADVLHLNAQGYELWASLIAAHLGSAPGRQTVAAAR